MLKLTQSNLNQLILGTSLLSTGGGGKLNSAKKLLKKINKMPKLISLTELKPQDLIVTLIGVGDKDVCNPVTASLTALKVFQKLFKQKVKAIIPVEIGPLSTLTAVFLASKLNLPMVDADIVGFRASPEVFLETITLANLSREPTVIANDKNDILILYRSSSIKVMEQSLRNFATVSGGDAYGVGYPLTAKQLNNVVGENSLSYSIQLGNNLKQLQSCQISLSQFCQNNGLIQLAQGEITRVKLQSKNGFIQGQYCLKTKQGEILTVFIKNENIALLKNRKPILTVPDSILLLDQNKFIGINNQDNNLNKSVIVLAKKAISIWRTKKGLALFNPRKLGYNINQKLL